MFDGSISEAGNGSMAFCKPYLGQLIVRSSYEVGQSGPQASVVTICDAVTVVAGVPCYSPVAPGRGLTVKCFDTVLWGHNFGDKVFGGLGR